MESHVGKIAIARRFPLIFVLLLAMAAWTSSFSAAQQQAAPPEGQVAGNPPPVPAEDVRQPQLALIDQSLTPETTRTTVQQLPANCPPEYAALIQKTTTSLMAANFAFYPIKALDPFVPFVTPETNPSQGEDEQQGGAPLTPLQKMTMSEIERGLKAVTWGDLGRKAVIEDSTGRGYIVTVGTPAGEHSGVITQILNDRLVIQQEIWDRKARKRFPQDFTIKLVKKADERG
jgi:hypothetical protein